MTARSLLLLGGGGHAAVVSDAARAIGFAIVGFLDDDPESRISAQVVGLTYLGVIDDLQQVVAKLDSVPALHAAIGDNALRRRWLDLAREVERASCPAVIHPSAVISPSARIGEGVFIGPLAVVNARAELGRGVIVNTGAIVEHDCVIGPFTHVGPGSTLGGFDRIGSDCLLGINASVLPNIVIGDRVRLGAGTVVHRNLPDGVTAVGVPARAINPVEA